MFSFLSKQDQTANNFIATNKNELLDEIINERLNDIEEFYDINLDKLDKRTKNIINTFIQKMEEDDKYKLKKKNEIKLIIYNNRSNTMDKLKIKI